MTICQGCQKRIGFGGVTDGRFWFCNRDCEQNYRSSPPIPIAVEAADAITMPEIVASIHQGTCPKCGGPGPIDLHTSYEVWSAIFLTQHKSVPMLCCRTCARKQQWAALGKSALLGWWGIPWGLVFTPIQIVNNLHGIISGPDPAKPSPALNEFIARNYY